MIAYALLSLLFEGITKFQLIKVYYFRKYFQKYVRTYKTASPVPRISESGMYNTYPQLPASSDTSCFGCIRVVHVAAMQQPKCSSGHPLRLTHLPCQHLLHQLRAAEEESGLLLVVVAGLVL